ncbi:unnamed protein product [Meganyctiphanes norvegica]|uniref:Rhodanese domain-containing protein n=1 Tax=Meganyctiphanes norvegica TaxID=48144 RepID=A0AAV2S1C1_MEGNR
MAWKVIWNTCALFIVVMLWTVPQHVEARPQSSPVPVPVNLQGDGLKDNLKGEELGDNAVQSQVLVKEEGTPVIVEEQTELDYKNATVVSSPINENIDNRDKIILSDFPEVRKSCSRSGVKKPININYDDLRSGLETGDVSLLIDVRNRTELETTCKLPWSVNVPLHEVTEAFALDENSFRERYGFPKPAPEDTNIVLTCRSGRRIQNAWKKLEPLGYCNIKLYSGSWLDWKARGGPLFPVLRDGKLLPEKCP